MDEIRYLNIISGRDRSARASLIRGGLAALSPIYGATVGLRNLWYDAAPGAVRRASVPVISIGNISTGGTGKTPMAAWIAVALLERGRRVAILTRGYKGSPVAFESERPQAAQAQWRVESDEAEVLRRRCPRATIFISPDRVASAAQAVASGCNVIVMDDGFQHRRLHRDLNVVLIDACAPFGMGGLLPRGTLRESPDSLSRADLVIMTRCDLMESPARELLRERLVKLAPRVPVLSCRHTVTGYTDLRGRPVPVEDPGAVEAMIFAGIASFDSFRRSIESLGIRVIAAYQFPDHHDYSDEEIAELTQTAHQLEVNALLTTEKDAVKLCGRWTNEAIPVLVPVIDMQFEDADADVLRAALDRVTQPPSAGASAASTPPAR